MSQSFLAPAKGGEAPNRVRTAPFCDTWPRGPFPVQIPRFSDAQVIVARGEVVKYGRALGFTEARGQGTLVLSCLI